MLRRDAGARALVFFSRPLFSIQAPGSPCMYDPHRLRIDTRSDGNIVVNNSQEKIGGAHGRRRRMDELGQVYSVKSRPNCRVFGS